ncbi:hypothetical protein AAL_08323 [Moelleriella libera RCEF 2490]|uniref:Uncharacterized protein n=1 Tax=Moelleriella libera RCEF 2490 TaxID=1081109 RepID=A0A167VKE0_9HYPO|nr:hypothetical protein AAL_08323 [Moelleriella libera RCEF 2490]
MAVLAFGPALLNALPVASDGAVVFSDPLTERDTHIQKIDKAQPNTEFHGNSGFAGLAGLADNLASANGFNGHSNPQPEEHNGHSDPSANIPPSRGKKMGPDGWYAGAENDLPPQYMGNPRAKRGSETNIMQIPKEKAPEDESNIMKIAPKQKPSA